MKMGFDKEEFKNSGASAAAGAAPCQGLGSMFMALMTTSAMNKTNIPTDVQTSAERYQR